MQIYIEIFKAELRNLQRMNYNYVACARSELLPQQCYIVMPQKVVHISSLTETRDIPDLKP